MTKQRLDEIQRRIALSAANPDDSVGVYGYDGEEDNFLRLLNLDELEDLLNSWEQYYERRGKHN